MSYKVLEKELYGLVMFSLKQYQNRLVYFCPSNYDANTVVDAIDKEIKKTIKRIKK